MITRLAVRPTSIETGAVGTTKHRSFDGSVGANQERQAAKLHPAQRQVACRVLEGVDARVARRFDRHRFITSHRAIVTPDFDMPTDVFRACGPSQPGRCRQCSVDVGDHLIAGRAVRLDVQDRSRFRGLGSEQSRPDRLRFRRVKTICVPAHASSSWPAE